MAATGLFPHNNYMASPTVPKDARQRPVVFETRSATKIGRPHRKPKRVFTWIAIGLIGAAACCGLAEGGSAVWSVLSPKSPDGTPPGLWFTPTTVQIRHQDDPVPQNGVPALLGHSSPSTTFLPLAPGSSGHVESGDPDSGGTNSGRPSTAGSPTTASSSSGRGSGSGRDGGGSGSRHGGSSGDG